VAKTKAKTPYIVSNVDVAGIIVSIDVQILKLQSSAKKERDPVNLARYDGAIKALLAVHSHIQKIIK
jgi:hypothetical protein